MRNRVLRLGIILIAGLMLLAGQQRALAQDEGPPALRQLAFFTVGGAAAGVLFGVAVWMLDPLAPSADVRLNALSGMGGGSIIGFAFGVMQLNRQATYPYQDEPIPTEFEQGRYLKPLLDPELKRYQMATEKIRPRGIPLFQFNHRF